MAATVKSLPYHSGGNRIDAGAGVDEMFPAVSGKSQWLSLKAARSRPSSRRRRIRNICGGGCRLLRLPALPPLRLPAASCLPRQLAAASRSPAHSHHCSALHWRGVGDQRSAEMAAAARRGIAGTGGANRWHPQNGDLLHQRRDEGRWRICSDGSVTLMWSAGAARALKT